MMTERAFFNGDEVVLPASRINVVFNQTHGDSDYPDAIVIDSDTAMQHYAWIEEVSDVAAAMFRATVLDWDGGVTKSVLDKSQPCFRRLAAMFDLTARAMIAKKSVAWKYPEDGLHPRYQANLADVAIAITDPVALRRLLEQHGG